MVGNAASPLATASPLSSMTAALTADVPRSIPRRRGTSVMGERIHRHSLWVPHGNGSEERIHHGVTEKQILDSVSSVPPWCISCLGSDGLRPWRGWRGRSPWRRPGSGRYPPPYERRRRRDSRRRRGGTAR